MALIHLHFYANKIGRCGNIDVIVPQKKSDDLTDNRNTPVLYLLHGAMGDETVWQRMTSIERYAEKYGFAVVMPGCEISAYTNMAHGQNYYDYITQELPELMYSFFGLSPARENNYIAGCSMGANGAVKIGLANPDKYTAIGCFSGGITYRLPPEDTSNIDPVTDHTAFMRYEGRQILGTEEDVFGNARRIAESGQPAPRIYHTIGNEDFLLEHAHNSRDFFTSFEGDPFGYVYEEIDGKHDWDFWDGALERFIEFIAKEFIKK